VPVWHELTKQLRADDELVVIGITQEQHAERCQLWAQWQQIDWPILWDPFNLTGSAAVPIAMAVDEQGVIRNMRLHPRKFEQQFVKEFMEMEFPAMLDGWVDSELGSKGKAGKGKAVLRAPMPWKIHLPALQKRVQDSPDDDAAWFRLGVALRMRFDDPIHAQADDFQRAIDHWRKSLSLNPGQYIWRRRIQQWGPRLDKPYPFYDWVDQARSEIQTRGEKPIALPVPVFAAAVASAEGSEAVAQNAHPDNDGMIPRDKDQVIAVRNAVVKHTKKAGSEDVARVHLLLQPDAKRDVHWSWDAGPCQVWIYDAKGWQIEQDFFRLQPGQKPASAGQGVNFEVKRTAGDAADAASELVGVAYYYVCIGESGECTFLAQDFRIALPD
jgi:hypothetical protein